MALLLFAAYADAQVTLTRGTNFSVDIAADGRITFDLLGIIWIIPQDGGVAEEISNSPAAARHPRWSPDSAAIVLQAREGDQEQLWLHRLDDNTTTNISAGQFYDHQPSWHPDGTRIVFSSDRKDSGFDLWELDLETGLTWRISHLQGDETEPAWSTDGEDLAYIYQQDDEWSLRLRRQGQPDQVLKTSATRLSNPAWRPDGSLITVMRHGADALSIDMVILSEPLLIKPLIENEDIFIAPLAWRDRHDMLYAANGQIRRRQFNSWTSRNVPFRATVYREQRSQPAAVQARDLPLFNEPEGQLVIRTTRLFDGVGVGYRENLDIVMQGGRIVAVEDRVDRPGSVLLDLGDLTALPGFIDGQVRLPADADPSLGPVLLSFGVTTIVTAVDNAEALNAIWSGKELPGPLVLGPQWQLDLDALSTMNLSVDALPTSPRGVRYEDARLSDTAEPATVLSGIADARTPGLSTLLSSRQAGLLHKQAVATRRFSEAPLLARQSSSIVLGSGPNGLPPGIGLHAEFRALQGAGLDATHILRTAGINAAKALGLGLQAGRIAPGSSADLVLVDGDPLNDIHDTLKIIGIVRNGRFFSTIGLIERVQTVQSVE